VLVLKMHKSERHPQYRYPVAMPVAGTMGSYGEVDDGYVYEKGFEYLHILPDLWKAAGSIWEKAMFERKVPSFEAEIKAEREKYKRTLSQCAQFKGNAAYESLVELRLNDGGDWLRRMSHIVLFAPDFGKTNPIYQGLMNMIKQAEEPKAAALRQLHEFIAAFMSSCITGVDLGGSEDNCHPFEQYPELKWDLMWHQAIVATIKKLRKAL
jgi:hypothetical protein